jgi:eukaryotic-like serine/threonine-protein kinase
MNNRTVQQYLTALASTPQLPFKHLKDSHFQLVYNDNKEPVRFFGNSSVVFKITDGEKFYALKCYVTELFYRWEYLEKVQQQIKSIQADWIVPFEIHKNEIAIESDTGKPETCNVILMPWVEGNRLTDLVKEYTSKNSLHDKLKELTLAIKDLANKQVGQPFSHGDISTDNIIVTPSGEMVLLDHDSCFFENCRKMAGQGGWSLAYQHPSRYPGQADLQADHFSFLTLAISLRAIELNPGLYQQFNSSKGLLFTIDDYKNPEYSKVFGEIKKIEDPYLQHLLGVLLASLKTKEIAIPELLQHLNGSGYTATQPVLPPQNDNENIAVEQEPAHTVMQPISSLVINNKGMIEEKNIQEEMIQHPAAEKAEEVMPAVQPVDPLMITDPAHQKKRKKTRIAIIAVLSSVLLVLLGIKAFFPATKLVNPVDYKKLGTYEKTGYAGIDIEKSDPSQLRNNSTDIITALSKEINNSVTLGLAQTNSDIQDIQTATNNGYVAKTTTNNKKNYYTKRNSKDNTVTFRKTGF